MPTAISAVAKRSLNRPLVALYSQMSQAQTHLSKDLQRDTNRQPVTIRPSSRLLEGRALSQDVWSIFKYIPAPLLSHPFLTCYSAVNLPPDCLNLGQGYMNFAPPKWVTAAAEEALNTVGPNHYSHPKGRLRLRQAIKQFYGPQFNRDLNVESEILVSSGANEGEFFRIPFHRASYPP
jgi:kynurenine aminotransferase